MGDEPERWGSYPAYEKAPPLRKSVEQQDKADADLAFLNAKAEKGWNAQAATDPLWKFKLIHGLLARYDFLNEYDYSGEGTEMRKTLLRSATARLCKEHDPKVIVKDYHARWLVSCFWGQDGLNRLDDKAKA